jgi:fatty acid-binding protein DegV
MVDVPVTLVDTGVGSFPVALAVWAAAEVLGAGGRIEQAAADLDTAIEAMIDGTVAAAGTGALRVGVGPAVHGEVAEQIRERLATELPGSEIVVYEVGPSVGAHTRPGTLGIVYTPV